MPAQTQSLPRSTGNDLLQLYDRAKLLGPSSGANDLLNAFLIKLRRKGWRYTTLARTLGLTSEAIRRRILIKGASSWALDNPRLPKVPDVPKNKPKQPPTSTPRGRNLSPAEQSALSELYPLAV